MIGTSEPTRFENYSVLLVRGDTSRLIVSMASRNPNDGNIQRFEWTATINRIGLRDNVIYIADLTRSWYTLADGWQDVCNFVSAFIQQNGITWSVAFGLSMGGFGAYLLADGVPIDRVIGLGAQTRIKDAAVFDWRFTNDWLKIEAPRIQNLGDVTKGKAERVFCTGCDDALDVVHVDLMRRDDPRVVGLIFQCGHHFSELHGNGKLDEVLLWLLQPKAVSETPYSAALPQSIAGLCSAIARGEMQLGLDTYLSHADRHDGLLPLSLYQEFSKLDGGDVKGFLARHNQDLIATHPESYFVRGWADPERWGRWSIGDIHEIRFRLPNHAHYSVSFLSMGIVVFGGAMQQSQEVWIFSSGQLMQRLSLTIQEGVIQKICVPILSEIVQIAFHTPNAISPFEIDGSMDDRKLAIGVMSAQIMSTKAF